MFKKRNGYYYVEEFEKYNLEALFSTKKIGFSNNLDYFINKDSSHFSFLTTNSTYKNLIYAKQTHSNNIISIDKNTTKYYYENVDGFITARSDVVLMTRFADCLPIYVYDIKNKIIGLCHSGWLGSYKGIQVNIINKMKHKYSSMNQNIIVALGIGIKSCCYEVQIDFYEKFTKKYSKDILEKVFHYKNNKLYFDNENFNFFILKEYGIPEENIVKSNICTYCHSDHLFFSYRKDKNSIGRNCAFLHIL